MALHQELLAEVKESPASSRIAALFDFDGTIVSGFSALHFLREQLKRGDISPRATGEVDRLLDQLW